MPLTLSKLSVLVVEDNLLMRKLVVAVLENLGVTQIATAADPVDGFSQFCADNHDIVIADWEMEPEGGLALVKHIRKNAISPNRMVPIIMLTGYSAPERVARARDGGVTEFLAKPFTAASLISRMTHVINRPRDFIEAATFFGPDRRRKSDVHYSGPEKRRMHMQ